MQKASKEWIPFGVMSLAWMGVLSWMEIQKFLSFKVGGDFGIYVQAIWSTAHGRPFYMSLLGGPSNFLGHHFAPILAVLAPFYRLWPDGRLLLTVYIAALAAAAIPLFRFARARLGWGTAMLVVLAYYLYAPLHSVVLSDFHEIGFAVPLLMLAGVALLEKRFGLSVFWLALAMLTKEEVVFIAIGFGLYIWFLQRRRRLGALVVITSLLWAVLLFAVVIPTLNGGNDYTFYSRYSTLGSSPKEMLQTLLLHPLTVAHLVFTPAKLQFVFQLLIPLAGISLLGTPIVLLALPTLAYLLLSDYGYMTSINYYYTAPMIPFLFLGAVMGLQRLRGWRPGLSFSLVVVLAGTSLMTAWLWSPLPGGRLYDPDSYRVTKADRAAQAALMTIPPEASVAAYGEYAGWLGNRFRLASIGKPGGPEIWPSTTTEYLAVHTMTPDAIEPPRYPWVLDPPVDGPVRVPRYTQLLQTEQGLAVQRWSGSEQDVILQRYDASFEQGVTLLAAGTPPEGPAWGTIVTATPDSTLPVWMVWGSSQQLDRQIAFSLHLVDADNRIVAQVDSEVAHGHFPSTLWHRYQSDLVIADAYPLELPEDLPPGRYHLLAGAFKTDTIAALSRPDGSQWIELAQVNVGR